MHIQFYTHYYSHNNCGIILSKCDYTCISWLILYCYKMSEHCFADSPEQAWRNIFLSHLCCFCLIYVESDTYYVVRTTFFYELHLLYHEKCHKSGAHENKKSGPHMKLSGAQETLNPHEKLNHALKSWSWEIKLMLMWK